MQERLSIANYDRELEQSMDVAFLNSKGFGGNNATASILSPELVGQMLNRRYGKQAMSAYRDRQQYTEERSNSYNNRYLKGDFNVLYRFGKGMLHDDQVTLDAQKIHIPGYGKDIDLTAASPYEDMVDLD